MINIFILIDALGWEYIKDRSFLNDIAVTKRSVKSILGFSSGVIPSILTGKYPQDHKHWSLYYYSPKTSPFRWTKALFWLPDSVLNTRLARKVIEEISKRLMGYTGYFETYLIPVRRLHLFDICEKKNIYAPGGTGEAENIFDILKKNEVDYKCFSYPLKDKEIIVKAKVSLEKDKSSFYFIYLSEFDALLHSSCKDKTKVNQAIDGYEKEIEEHYRLAKFRDKEVNIYIFSDHGMSVVDKSEDLKVEIENLGFKAPTDYVAFYDSTMARFWFYNPKAKNVIIELLKNKNYGNILSKEEVESLGVNFKDNMYGEVIFLINAGTVINPSFMGNKAPQGMHGYGVDDGVMDAVLIANKKIDIEIKDIKDVFKLMTDEALVKNRFFAPWAQNDEGVGAQNDEKIGAQNDRVKILYFLNSLVRGGVEEHVLQLIGKIDKEKFEPILVCPQQLLDLMREDLDRMKVKTYSIYIRKWRSIKVIYRFWKILRLEKPSIVHSHLFFATMFAAPLAKLAGVPKVIETAHLREAWRKGIKKAYFVDRFFYKFVDRIIAVSHAVKKYLVEEKKIKESKIEVIHNGVDLDKFRDSPLRVQSLQKRFTVGVIGRLEPQKGHKYFLEAVSLLNGGYQDARFIIVGEGSLRSELEQQAQKLGITERVEFLGYRKDIVNVLQEIDLLVLPSLYEGLPLVVLEAGTMEKPVIATNVDGSPEAIINNKTGLIISSQDSQALKEAIEVFVRDKELINEFGKNAGKHIRDNFDLKKQILKTEGLYSNLIKDTTE